MGRDPVVAEVRAVRERSTAECGNDLQEIGGSRTIECRQMRWEQGRRPDRPRNDAVPQGEMR